MGQQCQGREVVDTWIVFSRYNSLPLSTAWLCCLMSCWLDLSQSQFCVVLSFSRIVRSRRSMKDVLGTCCSWIFPSRMIYQYGLNFSKSLVSVVVSCHVKSLHDQSRFYVSSRVMRRTSAFDYWRRIGSMPFCRAIYSWSWCAPQVEAFLLEMTGCDGDATSFSSP